MSEQVDYLKLIELNLRRKGYLDIELARLFILAKDAQAEIQAKLNEYELLKLEKEQKEATSETTNEVTDESDDSNVTSPVKGDSEAASTPVQSQIDFDNNDELNKAEADSTTKATASTETN